MMCGSFSCRNGRLDAPVLCHRFHVRTTTMIKELLLDCDHCGSSHESGLLAAICIGVGVATSDPHFEMRFEPQLALGEIERTVSFTSNDESKPRIDFPRSCWIGF